MKKLIAVFAVLLFVAPAFAADWAFYGSERIGVWYTERAYPGDSDSAGNGSDAATQMYQHSNSRFGARVKADKVTGRVEFGMGTGGDGGDTSVATRLLYGTWKISDFTSLKIGKDVSPTTDILSNQWYAADADMLGIGNFYGRRPAGLTLMLGNFELAALVPSYGADLNTTATGINGITGTNDADSYIPRFEAAYTLKLGAGYIKPYGGFQYYTVKPGAAPGATPPTDELDVWSWVAGVSSNWNIGAFSIGANVSYGMNEGMVTGWSAGFKEATDAANRAPASAYLKTGGDDLADAYTFQGTVVAALKFTDTLRFEAGFGFRQDNADGAPGFSQKSEQWVTYLQALITLAPGVFLGPEVGYYDFMDGRDGDSDGFQWYAGSKFQIDF